MVAVLGGSGFLGRYIVQEFARSGALIRVGCRHPEEALFLKTQGEVGQIQLQACNIRDDESVKSFVENADIVINLVGIMYQTGQQTFTKVHAAGAERVARLAKQAGVRQLIHISALGVASDSDSYYSQTKGLAEQLVRQQFPEAVMIKPSLVFGPEDKFFNRFGEMAMYSPILPIFGGGNTRYQPVYVKDVAEAVFQVAEQEIKGQAFELGGPEVFTYKEMMQLILAETGRKCLMVPTPVFLGKMVGVFAQMLPKPPLTVDQMKLLSKDNIVQDGAKKLGDLGVAPHSLREILPTYIHRFKSQKVII